MLLSLRLNFWFARSRLRKGPQFDPSLKDFTRNPSIQQKIKSYRQQFQLRNIPQTFSHTLKAQKPRLGKRYKIDEKKLNKHLKKIMNDMIKPSQLIPASDQQDDFKFLNESKSFLHDQTIQTDFQQKFKKELFMKKQTERMLKKESNNYINFLPENKGNKYNQYLEDKNKLKNNRIQSMMDYRRHNQDLQLLIQSGFIDQPKNIEMIIEKMNPQHLLPFEQNAEELQSQRGLIIHKQKYVKNTDYNEDNFLEKHLLANINGPQQTRQFSKVDDFIQRYEANAQQSKEKIKEDVNLLLRIKQYQRQLFLSRYNNINYRFKGRVDFNHFKQNQLLSYIKNETIQPLDLLQVFDNNKDKLSKNGVPIITPAIMSRIYTKTSTYQFSENDQNNHINMLNHPIFKALQSSLFREVDKISDELFCDAAWSYAKNHELERGLLNINKSNAINDVIFRQSCERIYRLKEQDLGLLMRSIIKLNLLNNNKYDGKWAQIFHALEDRLHLMKMDYEYQSVMEFLTILPENQQTVALVGKNLIFFKRYQWLTKGTLITFSRVCSLLINHQELIDTFENNKIMNIMKQIVSMKTKQITNILPTLTINELSKILIIFHQLAKIPFGLQFPQILMNISKKQIVSSIHTQKHKIYQYTIPTILKTLSAYDYHNNIIKKKKKYSLNQVLVNPFYQNNVLKVVGIRHMLPGRVFTFNSKLYFVYHQIAKLLQVQDHMMTQKSLAESIFALSMVQYRNQGFFDTLTFKFLQRIQKRQNQTKDIKLSVNQTADLMKIVSAYSLQKRSTDLIEDICDQILENGKTSMKNVQINIMINFFGAYVNIFAQPTDISDHRDLDQLKVRWRRNKKFIFSFLYCLKSYMIPFCNNLEVEEIMLIYFTQTLILNNLGRILKENDVVQQEIQQAFAQSKNNIKILLRYLQRCEVNKNKIDYLYFISLCLKLNQFDIKIQDEQYEKLANFELYQKQFYDFHILQILRHEEHIGVSNSYHNVTRNVRKKIIGQKQNSKKYNDKPWIIQNQQAQQVYFFATFEHLMTKNHNNQTAFALFGIWRIYSQIYRRKGWDFNLICTMLQD